MSVPGSHPSADGGSESLHELLRLVDELLAQATEARQHWAELQEVLDEARMGGLPPAPAGESPAAAPRGDARPEPDPRRLLAVEMLVSGASRQEVSSYLRDRFGAEAAEQVLAEIYGEAGSGS